ncbi:MAG: pantetheine-phosphate adenylyltransferase [Flavobacteriales bacterium]|jgi:pantetheine-phosphate adenylyltransferase|nr:pantetheine-phosphate adenylyltransferase [Flavobacteriales bacterium]
MKKIAIFPGSFDPITKGHEDILLRMRPLFDKIIVAIGNNSTKKYMFGLEQRMRWIEQTFAEFDNIETDSFQGLTVNYCKEKDANFILRGLRNSNDFEYEKSIAQMNNTLVPNIETILVYTKPEYASISSTIIRDIIKNGSDASRFLPEEVKITSDKSSQ